MTPGQDGVLYGAIEGGGSKIECAMGYSHDRVLERHTVRTRDPSATLAEVADFFVTAQCTRGTIQALGIGFFGPLELRRDSPNYGHLLDTPKPGWSGTDLLGALRHRLPVPMGLDTDVAVAARAEWQLGAARDAGSVAYITVGTGIGVGFAPDVLKGHRLLHPEGGHLPVRTAPGDEHFAGVCPFHGACVEGLASGPAIHARWGRRLQDLPSDHPAWSILGHYLGQLAASIALLVPVERIVFGGGVLSGGALLPHIRDAAYACLQGYLAPLRTRDMLDRYIRGAALGADAGIAGAFLIAADRSAR